MQFLEAQHVEFTRHTYYGLGRKSSSGEKLGMRPTIRRSEHCRIVHNLLQVSVILTNRRCIESRCHVIGHRQVEHRIYRMLTFFFGRFT